MNVITNLDDANGNDFPVQLLYAANFWYVHKNPTLGLNIYAGDNGPLAPHLSSFTHNGL